MESDNALRRPRLRRWFLFDKVNEVLLSDQLHLKKSLDIPALTGVRFFAAASVAYAHLNSGAHAAFWGQPFDASPLGMSLFFCLSGFIIHYVYGASFAANARVAFGPFFLARFSRLYPLFFAVFLVGVLYHPELRAALRADPWHLVSYLTLTGTWWYWQYDGATLIELPTGLTWSIATEWFFYLAYALALYPIFRIRSARVSAVLLALVVGAAYLVFWFTFFSWEEWEPSVLARIPGAIAKTSDFANSFFRWLVYVSPYARLFEFVGGCLVCQLYFLIRDRPRTARNEALFWIGMVWIAVALWLFLYVDTPEGKWLRSYREIAFLTWAHMNCLFAPGILLVLLGLALGCRAAWLLALAPLVFLGEISYSIYLCHEFVASFAWVSADNRHKAIALAYDLFLTCVVAFGFYAMIELPAKRWLRAHVDLSFMRHVPVRGAIIVGLALAIGSIGYHSFGTPAPPSTVVAPATMPPSPAEIRQPSQ